MIALLFSFSTTTISGLLASTTWVVTLGGHIPQDRTFFFFHSPFRLMYMPFLTSTHVILTAKFPVDVSGSIAVSSLVFFLCQHLALIKNVIYCFTLLVTRLTKRGIY